MSDKTILAQFPLPLVVFPGEKLNLHIFEPRYRELIEDCKTENKRFGIPPFNNSKLNYFGTEVELLEISKVYDDGKMDIKTCGKRVYQIHQFYNELGPKLYPGASVTYVKADSSFDSTMAHQILGKMQRLFDVMKINHSIEKYRDGFSSFSIAHHAGLGIEQKIELLSMQNEMHRLKFINDHLDEMLPIVEKAESTRDRISQNGHFKNIDPPKF